MIFAQRNETSFNSTCSGLLLNDTSVSLSFESVHLVTGFTLAAADNSSWNVDALDEQLEVEYIGADMITVNTATALVILITLFKL